MPSERPCGRLQKPQVARNGPTAIAKALGTGEPQVARNGPTAIAKALGTGRASVYWLLEAGR